MVALLLLHLPHPSEAARSDLIQKLIVIPIFLFEVDRLAFKRCRDVRVIVGEGVPVKGKEYNRGDLFIKYNVKSPEKLSKEQRLAVYKVLTGTDYVDDDISDDYLYVDKKDISEYNTSGKNTYDSDDDHMHANGPNVSECRTQ